jgi:TonB-linked SusC/RagA family outer membrane protein
MGPNSASNNIYFQTDIQMYKKFTRFFCTPQGYIHKFLLIMKLTTVLLIVTMLQVSAAGLAQTVTFIKKDVTLKQIFTEINKQTGYSVLLSGAKAKSNQRIDANFNHASLDDVLKIVLENQSLDYVIEDKMIVIRDKEKTFIDKIKDAFTRDSTLLVTGRVINENGDPLSGASVNVVTSKSSVTISSGNDGHFWIYGEKGNIVTINYIGYESKRIKITKGELGDIKLQQKIDELKEVKIVIGYGTTTKMLTTGSVAVVTSADISKQPVSNVLQALQGMVPGLVVNQTNGFSSSPFDVKIRGQNSLAASGNIGVNKISEPLYIIDGVPVIAGSNSAQQNVGIEQNGLVTPTSGESPLFGLNPADVESVSVLKDADATAIYGARGANGVILITTKKGKAGKTKIDANVYTGLSLQTKKLHLMNTDEYLAMRKQAFKNDGFTPDDGNGYDLTIWDQNRYTDWQKELLGTAHTTDAQVSLSGGDSKTTFRLSGGFNTQSPPFAGNYKEQRGSGLLNITNSAFNDRLTTTAKVSFSSTSSNLPAADLTPLIFLAPNAPSLFDAAGNLNYDGWRAAGFPYQAANFKRPYSSNTDNLASSITLKYNILPGLDFNSSMGLNITRQKQLQTSPSGSFDPAYGIGRESNFGTNNNKTWVIEPSLNYSKTFGKSTLQTLLGTTFQRAEIDGTYIDARGYTNDAFLEDQGAASDYYLQSNYIKTKFESVYARINYNYDNKYIINLNGRRDGSSRFSAGRQFGNFGSIGGAWIFSNEQLIQDNLKFLSFGKIRASYGLVGGDGLGDYKYLSSFTTGYNPYQGTPALQLARLANDKFGWTTNKKLELALDLGFFKGRINAELAWYQNRSGNQLVSYPLAATAGFSSILTNLPALVQNKGLEFTLQTQNVISKDFQWNTNFNISQNKNKLIAFPGLASSSYANTYAIGRSISSIGMLHYTGVDATGNYTFADINKDGALDPYGNTDYIYKDGSPSFFGGMGNNLVYKDVQLSFFFAFTKQMGVLRLSNALPGTLSSGAGNQLILSEQSAGKPALENLTTISYRQDYYNYYSSDAVWVDASYIRLQNLSLAYNLPSKLLDKSKLHVKIYLQGQNLLTITGYKGTDPATPGVFTLPPRKIITAGIQATF